MVALTSYSRRRVSRGEADVGAFPETPLPSSSPFDRLPSLLPFKGEIKRGSSGYDLPPSRAERVNHPLRPAFVSGREDAEGCSRSVADVGLVCRESLAFTRLSEQGMRLIWLYRGDNEHVVRDG